MPAGEQLACFGAGMSMSPATLTMIREAEQASVTAFAKRLGIPRNAITAFEKGRRAIPPSIALAVTAIHRRIEPME